MPSGYTKAALKHPPLRKMVVWCPMCDWHLPDGFSARRRMGEHVSNDHYAEVVFPAGTEPPDFEDQKKRGKNENNMV